MSKWLDQIHTSCVQEWVNLQDILIKTEEKRFISDMCPKTLANLPRTISWSPVTNGDPVEGVTIPHSIHQFSVQYLSENMGTVNVTGLEGEQWNENQSEYVVFKSASQAHISLHTCAGPYTHYVRSTMGEKKSGAIYQIPFAGRPIQAAQRLLQLPAWLVDPDSYLRVLSGKCCSREN
jgi:hypothetical protein